MPGSQEAAEAEEEEEEDLKGERIIGLQLPDGLNVSAAGKHHVICCMPLQLPVKPAHATPFPPREFWSWHLRQSFSTVHDMNCGVCRTP